MKGALLFYFVQIIHVGIKSRETPRIEIEFLHRKNKAVNSLVVENFDFASAAS